jgi:hypothetical protein
VIRGTCRLRAIAGNSPAQSPSCASGARRARPTKSARRCARYVCATSALAPPRLVQSRERERPASTPCLQGPDALRRACAHARPRHRFRTGWTRRPRPSQFLKGTEPGLVGYWKLNEGPTASIFDSAVAGNHGPLMGARNRRRRAPRARHAARDCDAERLAAPALLGCALIISIARAHTAQLALISVRPLARHARPRPLPLVARRRRRPGVGCGALADGALAQALGRTRRAQAETLTRPAYECSPYSPCPPCPPFEPVMSEPRQTAACATQYVFVCTRPRHVMQSHAPLDATHKPEAIVIWTIHRP